MDHDSFAFTIPDVFISGETNPVLCWDLLRLGLLATRICQIL